MGRAWLPVVFGVAMLASCTAESPRAYAPPSVDAGRHVRPAADLASVVRNTAHAYRWNAGMLAGGASTYESRVSDRGVVAITPRTSARSLGPPFAPTRGAALSLETAYIARGARMIASGPAPATVGADGSVAIQRGDVTERLENDDAGVEQSWRFERAPDGEGDVVVVVRGAGQRFAASTEHGLHFTDGTLGLRYGAATWIDADGHRTTVTPRFEDGAIVMTVPSRVVASSRFPAVLDPTVSSEAEIDKPVMGSTSSAGGEQYNPSIASAGPNKG
ncbi:MAG TPA: hypothetical protein VIF62_23410, partial [Labilithrix sp.]